MNDELIQKLKKARFPYLIPPTLSELIKACGEEFGTLDNDRVGWLAYRKHDIKHGHLGNTPEEAVANLWLALNENHD